MRRTEILFLKLGLISLEDLIKEDGEYTSCFVLTDDNTARDCYPKVQGILPEHTLITIPAGEQAKNLETCQKVWSELTRHQADRKTLLVCLGGGMVTDLGGFCASIYKRGIDAIYLPTTLMGMADAATGSKTGTDFEDAKNMLGTFSNPRAIYLFPEFLETLPLEELLSGYAEIVKHALLQGGMAWNAVLERGKGFEDRMGLVELIEDSVTYKLTIVNQDPYEANLRKILNLGHTAGHAIESWKLQAGEPIPHGLAVAAGLAIEAYISLKKKILSKSSFQQMTDLIQSIFPKIKLPKGNVEAIARFALQDKKNGSNAIHGVLLKEIGKPSFNVQISMEELLAGLHWYSQEF